MDTPTEPRMDKHWTTESRIRPNVEYDPTSNTTQRQMWPNVEYDPNVYLIIERANLETLSTIYFDFIKDGRPPPRLSMNDHLGKFE
jgi:hypothetical protein